MDSRRLKFKYGYLTTLNPIQLKLGSRVELEGKSPRENASTWNWTKRQKRTERTIEKKKRIDMKDKEDLKALKRLFETDQNIQLGEFNKDTNEKDWARLCKEWAKIKIQTEQTTGRKPIWFEEIKQKILEGPNTRKIKPEWQWDRINTLAPRRTENDESVHTTKLKKCRGCQINKGSDSSELQCILRHQLKSKKRALQNNWVKKAKEIGEFFLEIPLESLDERRNQVQITGDKSHLDREINEKKGLGWVTSVVSDGKETAVAEFSSWIRDWPSAIRAEIRHYLDRFTGDTRKKMETLKSKNASLLLQIQAAIEAKETKLNLRKIKSHSNIQLHDNADALAKMAVNKYQQIDLSWKNLRIDDPSRAFVTQLISNILETIWAATENMRYWTIDKEKEEYDMQKQRRNRIYTCRVCLRERETQDHLTECPLLDLVWSVIEKECTELVIKKGTCRKKYDLEVQKNLFEVTKHEKH
ncbi:7095_t:CDS:2 [Gigaspora rosea]|nr:7095_t:CDS:2 [Gigaspora rosea]